MQDVSKRSCTVKSELGFLKTCGKNWVVFHCFSMFLIFQTNFQFQGSHIWADFAIYKHMATLKIKSDLILLLRKLKNPWIWILFFRVAKIWQSGLPYLWRIWRYNFKIDVRWWAKYQLKLPCIQILSGNSSRILPTVKPPVQSVCQSGTSAERRAEITFCRPFHFESVCLALPKNVLATAHQSEGANRVMKWQ